MNIADMGSLELTYIESKFTLHDPQTSKRHIPIMNILMNGKVFTGSDRVADKLSKRQMTDVNEFIRCSR